MKRDAYLLSTALATIFSVPLAFSNGNLSDDLDKNTTPAEFEEREEEGINKSDIQDENVTPAPLEYRAREEEVESDLNQTDDPEKAYDPLDEEFDE